jgi:nucleotide-binding universal stress UspA family protein
MDSQRGRVVVGFDGSRHSAAAVDWAAAEAERRQLPLTVLHAVDHQDVVDTSARCRPTARSLAEVEAEGVKRARRSAGSIDITAITCNAHAAFALIESSREAVLLVVGTHGNSDVPQALAGSVALAVSVNAHCPVIVVPDDSRLTASSATG